MGVQWYFVHQYGKTAYDANNNAVISGALNDAK